jgi:predicted double-glycine peptidase
MQKKRIAYLIQTIVLCFIASCSTAPVAGHSEPVVIANVPFYPQEKYQCGPASLAGVMNFWHAGVTPEEIAKDIYSDTARGTLNIDLLLYARKYGFDSLQYEGSWSDLTEKMKAGYPLVVLVDYGFSVFQVNHFMVIFGFNNEGVLANSGTTERKFINKNSFLKSWKRTNYWTLLIKQKDVKSER